ncbi:MAG TPA: hypothetical protein ENN73_07015 [Firmicutes bacterium]|nr:hypothetical protein [Bacillota bacterium]
MDLKHPLGTRPDQYAGVRESGYNYNPAKVNEEFIYPVFPFSIFFISIREEIFVELEHEHWWTLEICNFGGEWFVLDAIASGEQFLGVDKGMPCEIYLNLPVIKFEPGLQVMKSGNAYNVMYTSIDGENIRIDFIIKSKPIKLKRRNGSTMGHSDNLIWALIDIEELRLGKASVIIDNEEAEPKYLIPKIIQKSFLIKQTIAGIPQSDEVEMSLINSEEMHGFVIDSQDKTSVTWKGEVYNQFETRYNFIKSGDDYLELFAIEGRFEGDEIVKFEFFPALPDLRYINPEHEWSGKFSVSLNGIFGYSTGSVEVVNESGVIYCTLFPEYPYWASNRHIRSRIRYQGENSGDIIRENFLVPK